MDRAKVVSSLPATHFRMSIEQFFPKNKGKEDMERVPYASAVGSLMYEMVCQRTDIALAAGVVVISCQIQEKSIGMHFQFETQFWKWTIIVSWIHGYRYGKRCRYQQVYIELFDYFFWWGYSLVIEILECITLHMTEAEFIAATQTTRVSIDKEVHKRTWFQPAKLRVILSQLECYSS